jgi:hypothetical protein
MGPYVSGSFCAGLLCDGSFCDGFFSDGNLCRGTLQFKCYLPQKEKKYVHTGRGEGVHVS